MEKTRTGRLRIISRFVRAEVQGYCDTTKFTFERISYTVEELASVILA